MATRAQGTIEKTTLTVLFDKKVLNNFQAGSVCI